MKVSIVTVVLNRVAEVEETILSVVNQDYKDIEYIVVDGGSNDGTLKVVKKYQNKISKVISEPDNGLYDAINKGIRNSTGDIIGLIHAGDTLYNNQVINKLVNHFIVTNADVVYGNTLLVDPIQTEKVVRLYVGGEFNAKRFLTGWMPSHTSTFIKNSVYKEYGLYRLDLNIAADYELLLRTMYKNAVKCSYYPELIARFRVGGISNKNIKSIFKSSIQCYKSWRLNKIRVPFYTIPLKLLRRIPDIIFKNQRYKQFTKKIT